MDQGVIQNLKVNYRKLVLRWRIGEIEADKDYMRNLISSLHLLRRAWDKVKGNTIKNCFRHAKFIHNAMLTEVGSGKDFETYFGQLDEDMGGMLNAWIEIEGLEETITAMADFLNVDELVETCDALTMTDIIEDLSEHPGSGNQFGSGKSISSEILETEELEIDLQSVVLKHKGISNSFVSTWKRSLLILPFSVTAMQ